MISDKMQDISSSQTEIRSLTIAKWNVEKASDQSQFPMVEEILLVSFNYIPVVSDNNKSYLVSILN